MVMATARIGSTELFNVHDQKVCAGRPCVIHNQSDHHMRDWPLEWSNERRWAERCCPHFQWHPDPDDRVWRENMERNALVHPCDGCCDPPDPATPAEAVIELLAMARALQD